MKVVPSIGLAALITLAGAGCTAKQNAHDSVEQSLEVYQFCISEHTQDPSSCEEAWRIYQDDLRAYQALSPGDQ